MSKPFEQLWEEAESLHKQINDNASVASIIDELSSKFAVYRALEQNDKMEANEKAKLKSHMFSKILASLTNLSLRDNVNVYTSLQGTIEELKIDYLESKY